MNGKFYVGMHSTDNLKDGYLGSGKRLRYSIRKYGKKQFTLEIIKFYKSRSELKLAEIDLVNEKLLLDPLCMNLRHGGEGGLDGMDDATIKRIREGASKSAIEQWADPDFCKMMQAIRSASMARRHEAGLIKYDTFSGKTHSDETRIKIKNSRIGKNTGIENSQFGTCWITKDGMNKKIKKTELEEYILNGWLRGRV